MDFSQFNGVEQAHMTKVIEKKQVNRLARDSEVAIVSCRFVRTRIPTRRAVSMVHGDGEP